MKKIAAKVVKVSTDNYSYWEYQQYFKSYDLLVVGSGIVGLSTAIAFKQNNKKAKVLVLERGFLPDGASTKNAGFACFGSPGELLADLRSMDQETVWDTFAMRYQGLELLKKRLGKKAMDYRRYGGFELFTNGEKFEQCKSELAMLNSAAFDAIGQKACFSVQDATKLPFKHLKGVLVNKLEGQIDTGLMMTSLTELARSLDITILNCVEVKHISDQTGKVLVNTNRGFFEATKVVVAVNGFANALLQLSDLAPARAQVLITSPIKNLPFKGTFHFDEGFYYFRNIHKRVLFGGGRNADFKTEVTTEPGVTLVIQSKLEFYLKKMILPNCDYQIEKRWSGVMGIGKEKKPIIKKVSPNVIAAVRMGGMGVAIGSLVGELAAELVN